MIYDDKLAIKVEVKYKDILPKIKAHLSVIGKRAVDGQGNSFYKDLTTSVTEDVIYNEFILSGAEIVASRLTDVCSNYDDSDGVTFVVFNDRWIKADEEFIGDLRMALESAIGRYLVNFAVLEFLQSITPSTGTHTVPMYGKSYADHCVTILENIKTLAFHKRPSSSPAISYAQMMGDVTITEEDGWFRVDVHHLDSGKKLKY